MAGLDGLGFTIFYPFLAESFPTGWAFDADENEFTFVLAPDGCAMCEAVVVANASDVGQPLGSGKYVIEDMSSQPTSFVMRFHDAPLASENAADLQQLHRQGVSAVVAAEAHQEHGVSGDLFGLFPALETTQEPNVTHGRDDYAHKATFGLDMGRARPCAGGYLSYSAYDHMVQRPPPSQRDDRRRLYAEIKRPQYLPSAWAGVSTPTPYVAAQPGPDLLYPNTTSAGHLGTEFSPYGYCEYSAFRAYRFGEDRSKLVLDKALPEGLARFSAGPRNMAHAWVLRPWHAAHFDPVSDHFKQTYEQMLIGVAHQLASASLGRDSQHFIERARQEGYASEGAAGPPGQVRAWAHHLKALAASYAESGNPDSLRAIELSLLAIAGWQNADGSMKGGQVSYMDGYLLHGVLDAMMLVPRTNNIYQIGHTIAFGNDDGDGLVRAILASNADNGELVGCTGCSSNGAHTTTIDPLVAAAYLAATVPGPGATSTDPALAREIVAFLVDYLDDGVNGGARPFAIADDWPTHQWRGESYGRLLPLLTQWATTAPSLWPQTVARTVNRPIAHLPPINVESAAPPLAPELWLTGSSSTPLNPPVIPPLLPPVTEPSSPPVPTSPPSGGPANAPPQVSLLSPVDATLFVLGEEVALRANVSDDDGSVSVVEFYQGSTLLVRDSDAPYAFSWHAPGAGSYALTAVATDNSGNSTTSNPVTVHVAHATGSVTLQQGLAGYTGTSDTYFFEAHNSLNFGSSSELKDKVSGSRFISLVRFAVFQSEGGPVPDGSLITSATLSLYKSSVYDHVYRLHPLLAPWQEDEATWDERQSGTPWDGAGVTAVGVDFGSSPDAESSADWEPSWVDFDVTAALGAMSAGESNHGWLLLPVAGNGNGKTFISSENTTSPLQRPKLVIEFVEGGDGGTGGPTVALTSPASGATFAQGTAINLSAAANVGVTKVAFYQGGTLLSEDSVAPYGFTWANPGPGDYSFSAVATDTGGTSTLSRPVVVTVTATTGSEQEPGTGETGGSSPDSGGSGGSTPDTGGSGGSSPDTGGSTPDSGGDPSEVACDVTAETSTQTAASMSASHRHGQTFVTWADRATGAAGAAYRYRLYRSSTPITSDADLATAELVASEIPNHSGQMFGEGFRPEYRIDPSRPTTKISTDSAPLPLWSGLWVATTPAAGCRYYAVLATDVNDEPVESVVPDVNATTEPIAELVRPRQAIQRWHSDERGGPYIATTRTTGTVNLPLYVELHSSNATGGPVRGGSYGDYYSYFGTPDMGYQDGLPGIFSMQESHTANPMLLMRHRDTVLRPAILPQETLWFGYVSTTRTSEERLARPFTETRLDWMIPWAADHYQVDKNRIYVGGGSMGAWGTMTYASRRPDVFAAIYPDRPRFRQHSMRVLNPPGSSTEHVLMPDGQRWQDHNDSIKFVSENPQDLPFIGWNCGRYDGFATWQEQVEMVAAMTAQRHGFAFAWNNGDHTTGAAAKAEIQKWYPPERFALNESFPAFSNSSIDDDLGNGDPADGDLVGGINLGFEWDVNTDSSTSWVLTLSNALAEAEMTVDVTPRRLQRFLPGPGSVVSFSTSRGRVGSITVDDAGRITVTGVRLLPGESTVLTLTR